MKPALLLLCVAMTTLAAHGESLAAFDGRCIPDGRVAPSANTHGILSRHAFHPTTQTTRGGGPGSPSGRLTRLGATPDSHHGLLVQDRTAAAPITVSAAISLSDALEEAGRVYRAATGLEVRFNFAGSNVLARQIVSGAPVDLFISADEAQMRLAESAGAIAPETRVDLLGNRLAVVLSESAAAVSDVSGLAQPSVRRIAIGDPEAVPAGVYAKQYLQAAGVWERIASKVVPVGNVRAALAAAENATVDAAIVYESDLAATSRVRVAFVVSGAHAPRIVYPAAVVAQSKNRAAAERFLAFLRGAEASALFKRYRFQPRLPQH